MSHEMAPIIVTVITSFVAVFAGTGFWSYAIERRRERRGEDETLELLKQGEKALLHDTLSQNCQRYIKAGQITEGEFRDLHEIYDIYVAFGGNGSGKTYMEEVTKILVDTSRTKQISFE